MQKKTRVAMIAATAIAALGLAACGGGTAAPGGAAGGGSAAPTTMKLAHNQTEKHTTHVALTAMGQLRLRMGRELTAAGTSSSTRTPPSATRTSTSRR